MIIPNTLSVFFTLTMEYGAFEKVPQNKRSYSFWDQTVFWFSTVSLPAAWLYGALMAGWKGVLAATLLIVGVNALSLIPWAYLGKMAQETGGSMMALARPAFGIKGSVVPSVFYLIFGMGWALVNAFLGSIALSFIFFFWLKWPAYLAPHSGPFMIMYLAIFAVLNGTFSIAGHNWIKKLQWAATIFFLILGFYQTFLVVNHWGLAKVLSWKPTTTLFYNSGPFVFPITFAFLFDLMVSYNWTWEFIGDFSRFAKTKNAGTWAPFIGAFIGQVWWFFVGALAVASLALTKTGYNPLLADPSSATVQLGLGWLAALIILFATVTTDAGNLYASALSISNMLPKIKLSLRKLLVVVSLFVFPLSLLPLLFGNLLSFFIFFLDFVGALAIPLWTLMLVDYFFVKKTYSDDMYKKDGGKYWYTKGWNWKSIVTLFAGTGVYWLFAYFLPNSVRTITTATIPTVLFVGIVHYFFAKKK
ncbi:MAG: purine-cytosine permease family protein [Candidatus Levyibacteriota bacterium]